MDYVTQRIRDYAKSVADDLARLKLDAVTLAEIGPGSDKGALKVLDLRVGLGHPLKNLLRDPLALDALESGVGAQRAINFISYLRTEAGKPRGWPETRAALEEWARKAGVEHCLSWTARPARGWELNTPHLPIADVFDDAAWGEVQAVYGWNSKKHARQTAWARLVEEAKEVAAAREQPVGPWPVPEGQARRLAERLTALRAPTLGRWPRRDDSQVESLYIDSHEGIARLDFEAEVRPDSDRAYQPRVQIPLRSDGAPSCSCEAPACFHVAASLDRLCRSLGVNDHYAHSLAAAGAPSWGHVLLALDRRHRDSNAGRLAGFRVKLDIEATVDALEAGERGKKPRKAVAQTLLDAGEDLSAQERKVLELLAARQRFHEQNGFTGEALWALRGHPAVWLRVREAERKFPDRQVKVTGCEPVLTFVDGPGGTTMKWQVAGELLDELPAYPRVSCFDEGVLYPLVREGELLLVRLSADAAAFEQACERYGREFPPESHADLLRALGSLKRVASELPKSLRGAERPAQHALTVRAIFAAGPQLDVSFQVRPLEGGPSLAPGSGAVEVAQWREAGRVFCRRDFAEELKAAATLSTRLALPHHEETDEERFAWRLTEPDQVLETAARLSEVAKEGVTVELPAETLSVTRPAQTKDLRLRLTAKGAWFKLDGKASFDGVEVPLEKVLEAIRGGRRWVELSAGRLARLSEQLAQALGPVALSSKGDEDVELTLPQVAALSANEAAFGQLESAVVVKKLLEKIAGADEARPAVPKGFKAKLREYQQEGFEWLSRLASWAPGAVLADDMGLGKTVQALALLCARAKRGPQLVVAPTSVTSNWVSEAARFAPALEVKLLRDGERATAIAQAKAGEVLVVSWTLMAKEIAALEQREFATVVLDESQAIKNAGTLRAQSARKLKGAFTVALTGTPLENHLGELWSLFRVVSPGLFGSEDLFRGRYWTPIERGDERAKALAWASLRALVKPFLLRRRKDEVAKELPKKTEITRLVELSAREGGVYEAARVEALEALETAVEQRGEEARFHVLAALTRLRQLSCHVGLVDESWGEGSSKLSALVELLGELKDEGHRVLVFSQFTSLLAKAKEAVTAAGLSWLLLQGDTPAAERQQLVERFQAGEADVFLLSLKAGGTGLNLTAADYVVHLDPWWNPAVEDQASDRAHRIGQSRPVTVYRLVAQGTIEEKILALHGKKRELVDAVLEGTQAASKLTAKELVELLSQG